MHQYVASCYFRNSLHRCCFPKKYLQSKRLNCLFRLLIWLCLLPIMAFVFPDSFHNCFNSIYVWLAFSIIENVWSFRINRFIDPVLCKEAKLHPQSCLAASFSSIFYLQGRRTGNEPFYRPICSEQSDKSLNSILSVYLFSTLELLEDRSEEDNGSQKPSATNHHQFLIYHRPRHKNDIDIYMDYDDDSD